MAEEIDEVVKEKRKLLKFFCTVVQVLGWFLFFGGVFWFLHLVAGSGEKLSYETWQGIEQLLTMISWFTFDFVFIGLVTVILAQLARYTLERDNKTGLLLRSADKILYFFAFLVILWAFFRIRLNVALIEEARFRFLYIQPLILPTIAKALILIGFAQILRRIIPVIDEYKSLV